MKSELKAYFSFKKNMLSCLVGKLGVFWLNIAKFEVNWCYRYCYNLFSNMRKESELRQYQCRNSTKVGKRKIKSRREKFLIFGNGIAAIPFAHTCCPGGCSKCECAQGKPNDGKIFFWQLWQCHCRKWEEKKNSLRQWHCRNREYKFLSIVAMALPK